VEVLISLDVAVSLELVDKPYSDQDVWSCVTYTIGSTSEFLNSASLSQNQSKGSIFLII